MPIMKMPTALAALALLAAPSLAADRQTTPAKDAAPTGNLDTLMRARGRDQLIICGVYAHIGCLFTAAEAFQRDIQPFFAADALGDFSRAWHDMALAQAADCCAHVLSTRNLMDRIA